MEERIKREKKQKERKRVRVEKISGIIFSGSKYLEVFTFKRMEKDATSDNEVNIHYITL